METVCQLDEDDADVIDHRQQHLAECLGLALLRGGESDRTDLRDPLHDVGHLGTEELVDALDGREGIFNHVVQQAGRHRHDVQFHVGKKVRNCKRMDEIGLARVADLSPVLERREHIGPAQQFDIGGRTVRPDLFYEILEANHEMRCLSIILT